MNNFHNTNWHLERIGNTTQGNMSLLSNQTFQTIIAGVLIFTLGQIIQNFVLKPIQDFMVLKVEISHKVKFHSNILTNSGIKPKRIDWASGDMRDLSSQLESKYIIIPIKWLFILLRIIPSKKDIKDAVTCLTFLSNAGGQAEYISENANKIDKLKKDLKIEL